jgi:hypothetical protein
VTKAVGAAKPSAPNAEVVEVVKHTIEIRDPQNQNDDDQAIQDRFDLPLHRDKPVDEPKDKAYRDNCDDDSGKWHFKRSNPADKKHTTTGLHPKDGGSPKKYTSN